MFLNDRFLGRLPLCNVPDWSPNQYYPGRHGDYDVDNVRVIRLDTEGVFKGLSVQSVALSYVPDLTRYKLIWGYYRIFDIMHLIWL